MNLPNELWEMIIMKSVWIEDLITCTKVCQTWSQLAQRRLVKVKYLFSYQIGDDEDHYPEPTSTREDVLFYRELGVRGDTPLLDYVKLLNNLEIIEVHDHGMTTEAIIRELFELKPKLKGLWFGYPLWFPLGKYIEDLDMLSIMGIGQAMDDMIEYCSPTLRQLFLETARDVLMDIIAEFSGLLRLHIEEFDGDPLYLYDGPAIECLQILEIMVFDDDHSDPSAFGSLIDYCPDLRSLFIAFDSVSTFIYDPLIINPNLENLVIEYLGDCHETRDCLHRFLRKFPNLKNLGIHGSKKMNDFAVEKILSTLNQLELLDLRGCIGITEKSEDYVAKYLPAGFKYLRGDYPNHDIRHDEKIVCHGFDFMKNIFFKSFKNIPIFMIPEDEEEERDKDTNYDENDSSSEADYVDLSINQSSRDSVKPFICE